MISQNEFREWKSHPVTEAFFKTIGESIALAVEQLITNVDEGSLPDEYLRGYIIANRDILKADIAMEEDEDA